MWRVALLLVVGCGKHLNPAWCAQPGRSDPACDGMDLIDAASDASAGACTVDRDCPDTACLPGGSCAVASRVLYAASSGRGDTCTRDAKCLLATAIAAAQPGKNIILLEQGTYVGAVAIGRAVQIVGRLATLQGDASAATVTVNDVDAELDYVTITGGGTSGISCPGGTLVAHGITVTQNQQGIASGCRLTLEQSVISSNGGGALAISGGVIRVRNNFLFGNGPSPQKIANVTIALGVTGSFVFNTVANNDAKANSTTSGVDCQAANLVVDGNLITDNLLNKKLGDPQVSGTCDFSRSYTAPGTGGNDLAWRNVVAADYHLTAGSTPVLDQPAGTLTCDGIDDFDGQTRPQGHGCDYGADEFKP